MGVDLSSFVMFCSFLQEEDGIRDGRVTGVQTCALPISTGSEIRPPYRTRLNTSRPNASVPKGWAIVGACRRSTTFWVNGPYGAISGAATLTMIQANATLPPTRTSGLRRQN